MASASISSTGTRDALASIIQSVTRLTQVVEACWQQSRNRKIRWALRELSHVLGVLVSLGDSLQDPVSGGRLATVCLLVAEEGPIQQFQQLLSELGRRMSGSILTDDSFVELIKALERYRGLFRDALEGELNASHSIDAARGTGSLSPSHLKIACDLCYNFGSSELIGGWKSLEALAASSSNGCEGCTVLNTILQPYKSTHEGILLHMGDAEMDIAMRIYAADADLEVYMSPGTLNAILSKLS